MNPKAQILRLGVLLALFVVIRCLSTDTPINDTLLKTGIIFIGATGIMLMAYRVIWRIFSQSRLGAPAVADEPVKNEQEQVAGATPVV
jgi:hypothetical protein